VLPCAKRRWPRGLRRQLAILLRFVLLLIPLVASAQDDAALRLAARLQAPAVPGSLLHDPAALQRFYMGRGFEPAWTGPGCARRLTELGESIASVDSHGLDPRAYHLEALRSPTACAEDIELLATDAFLLMAAHLHGGRLDPATVEPDWSAQRPGVDAVFELQQALADDAVAARLEALAPKDAFYRSLRAALAEERARLDAPRPPPVSPGPTLRPGDSGPRVAQLRALLRAEGVLQDASPWTVAALEFEAYDPVLGSSTPIDAEHALPAAEDSFDPGMEEALKRYQQRANLEPDGVAGVLSLAQLARGPAERIQQVRANLERWRWLPRDLGARHIRVNIADYRLEAWSGDRVDRVHRVMVGTLYRQTPSFSADLRYVVLNPSWEVPRRLAVQDKLPLFRRDPAAFQRLGYELLDASGQVIDAAGIDFSALSRQRFPYRLRQRPGPANALGQVKLILPNRHDIYLHDTPSRGLFDRVRRSFSSGCIRVEDALGLAEWTLAGRPDADRARIDAVLASGVETRLDLDAAVPVHLLYLTVAASEEGGLRYLDDLYGRDAVLLRALDAGPGDD
jgi:murein L,D-transpeptidase YcbB/YkuD